MEWIWLTVGLVVGSLVGWWSARRAVAPQLSDDGTQISNLSQTVSRLEKELAAAGDRATDLDRRLADGEAAARTAEHDLETLGAELAASRQELTDTKHSLKALKHEHEHAAALGAELAQKLKVAEAASAEAQARYGQITEEFVSLKRAARRAETERDEVLADRDGTVTQLREAADQAERHAAEVVAGKADLERSLSVATARLEALAGCAETAAEAQEELRMLRTTVAQQRRRIATLEADLQAEGKERHGPQDEPAPAPSEGPREDPIPQALAADQGIVPDGPATSTVSSPGAGLSEASTENDGDPLQEIHGIGPKFERLLNERNITTFRQVAEMDGDDGWENYLETFPGRIEREDWRSQARALHLEKYGEHV